MPGRGLTRYGAEPPGYIRLVEHMASHTFPFVTDVISSIEMSLSTGVQILLLAPMLQLSICVNYISCQAQCLVVDYC